MKNQVTHIKPIQPQIDVWLKANNILPEKSELFKDFIFSMIKCIEGTYMGDDVTLTEKDKQKHFIWCWNKVIGNFEKEQIFFDKTGQHYDYFWTFFSDAFYYDDEAKVTTLKVEEFFNIIFNLNIKKTKAELDMLADLYKILENSIKKPA